MGRPIKKKNFGNESSRQKVSIAIAAGTLAKVDKQSKTQDTTRSALIEKAVEMFLDQSGYVTAHDSNALFLKYLSESEISAPMFVSPYHGYNLFSFFENLDARSNKKIEELVVTTIPESLVKKLADMGLLAEDHWTNLQANLVKIEQLFRRPRSSGMKGMRRLEGDERFSFVHGMFWRERAVLGNWKFSQVDGHAAIMVDVHSMWVLDSRNPRQKDDFDHYLRLFNGVSPRA